MPVEFYVYPESDTPQNRAAWDASVQMLATFAPLFGEYPFFEEKYGIVQFGFGGGMEHQTITGQGGFGESLAAHELAHQWWGDMVTCRYWEDIWFNEGFATYSEALWLESKPGSSGLQALRSAMQSRKPSNVNGSVYCYDSGNVSRIFSSNFSYRKGAWVLHQLRRVVGDATFFEILAEWRRRHAYATATTEEFIDTAEDVSGRSLRWFFDPWVYERGALAYRWGTQQVQVADGRYRLVHLRQAQSATYPRFTMPVDLRFVMAGQTVTRSLWNSAGLQHYVVPLSGSATSPQAGAVEYMSDYEAGSGKSSSSAMRDERTTAPESGFELQPGQRPHDTVIKKADPANAASVPSQSAAPPVTDGGRGRRGRN